MDPPHPGTMDRDSGGNLHNGKTDTQFEITRGTDGRKVGEMDTVQDTIEQRGLRKGHVMKLRERRDT